MVQKIQHETFLRESVLFLQNYFYPINLLFSAKMNSVGNHFLVFFPILTDLAYSTYVIPIIRDPLLGLDIL